MLQAIKFACIAATTAAATCTGLSAGLPAAECNAWLDLFDGTRGDFWKDCSSHRLDPCAAGGEQDNGVYCSRDNGHIESIILHSNNLNGTLATSLSAFTELTSLNLRFNSLRGSIPPALAKLTKLTDLLLQVNQFAGLVPALPFAQYSSYCCLQMHAVNVNKFRCPLPPVLTSAVTAAKSLANEKQAARPSKLIIN
jgi:hypothetical protein